jgi:hypothetical protein
MRPAICRQARRLRTAEQRVRAQRLAGADPEHLRVANDATLRDLNPLLQLTYERHFLIITVHHLLTVTELLPDDHLPVPFERALLADLRNLVEHWEDPRGRAGKALSLVDPEIKPHAHRWTDDDAFLGGVSVNEIVGWARDLDRRLQRTLRH